MSDTEKTPTCSEKIQFDAESCKIRNFERNKNFYGKLMTVADFDNEQKYFMGKIQLMNKFIHGSGIVCGCEVKSIHKEGDGIWKAKVSQGYALDCCGREILSPKDNVECGVELPDGIIFDGQDRVGVWATRKDVLRSPVPSAANNSTCDEVCCYSRVEEKFTLKFDYIPISKSNLEVAFDNGIYNAGDTVNVHIRDESVESDEDEDEDDIGALASVMLKSNTDPIGISLELREMDNKPHVFVGSFALVEDSPSSEKNLSVNGSDGDDIILEYKDMKVYASVLSGEMESDKKRLSNNYYRNQLRECPECSSGMEGPKVLLAIVDKKNESIIVDESETSRYRSIVCNNPMLCDVIGEHLLNFNNPHKVTAEQVSALKTINGIGNTDKGTYVPNIDLVSLDETIKITPQEDGNRVDLSATNSGDGNGISVESGSKTLTIGKLQYIVKGPFGHRLDLGEDDPLPIIILAKEFRDEKTIQYMEDLGFVLSMLPLRLRPQSDLDAEMAKRIGIRETLERPEGNTPESQLFIFKAVNITKKEFHILVINHTQVDQEIRLRWWAIPGKERQPT